MNINKNWKYVFLLLIICDIVYTFIQNDNTMMLDGDIAGIIIPIDSYKEVLSDPFGLDVVLHGDYYAAPNRFFIHFIMQKYFLLAPFVFQMNWDPIEIAVVLFTVAKRRRQTLKYFHTHWKQGIAAGLLSISAFSAFLWAIQSAPLEPIAALRETSIIFAALIGVSKFNEGYAKLRISASIGVATGIAVLLYFS